MLTRFLLFLAPLASSTVIDKSISKRQTIVSLPIRNPATNANLGTLNTLTTINAGVTEWLSGLGTHNFYGNLNNSGTVIISQTDYTTVIPSGQTCDWTGTDYTNGNLNNAVGALISLNDVYATSAPTYDWYLNSFNNAGALQMCGRGDTGGSTYQLYCKRDCTNNGLITFEQVYGNLGQSFEWRNTVLAAPGTTGFNIYNNGAFRLINVVYHQQQNVYGTGCWQIGAASTLYLEDGTGYYQNPAFGPSLNGQSITFLDATGTLHMDTQVYSHNSNFGARVFNFKTGNAIEFYETIASFQYVALTGILTVIFTSTNRVNINLGLGYTATSFFKQANPKFYYTAGYNAIFYNGNAPVQTLPATCALYTAPCAALPAATTTTTTCAAGANRGGNFAYYNSISGINSDYVFSQFDPTVYKTIKPAAQSVTTEIGFVNRCTDGPVIIHGNAGLSCYTEVQQYTAFIYAATAGTYVFRTYPVDDLLLLWTGTKARTGWTRNNADLVRYYEDNTRSLVPADAAFTVTLAAGAYLPFRVMYTNAELYATFDVEVYDPTGVKIFGNDTAVANAQIVRYSCDGVAAPAFLPFGAET